MGNCCEQGDARADRERDRKHQRAMDIIAQHMQRLEDRLNAKRVEMARIREQLTDAYRHLVYGREKAPQELGPAGLQFLLTHYSRDQIMNTFRPLMMAAHHISQDTQRLQAEYAAWAQRRDVISRAFAQEASVRANAEIMELLPKTAGDSFLDKLSEREEQFEELEAGVDEVHGVLTQKVTTGGMADEDEFMTFFATFLGPENPHVVAPLPDLRNVVPAAPTSVLPTGPKRERMAEESPRREAQLDVLLL